MSYKKDILTIINSSRQHLTAENIYLQMKADGSKIVMATVYNNLSVLLKEHLIRCISIEGQPDRYDRAEKHDHLICQRCGRISDICFPDLTELLQTQIKEQLISYDLRVAYICPECRKAESDESCCSKNQENEEGKQ